MDKTAIKNFSIWARNKLIADITYKAGLLGVTEEGIKDALPQSTQDAEFYDIGTKEPYAIHGEEIKQRRELVAAIKRKATQLDYKDAYRNVVEEVAYTWFNRLIAIRFMEVNDYMPAHIRVLSSDSKNKLEPDLVTTPFDAELEFTQAETEKIMQMKNDNQVDALFRFLFIKQCNALNAYLPKLFEKTSDYTELLLNVSVTDQDGIVYHLTHDIAEADFNITDLGEDGKPTGQVEIIGWMYQYYNTEPKDEAFALLKSNVKITKERIPAATQLFTPDWIVRYMVENSVGRLWLEGHEDNNLKDGWKYYLDEAEQEADVAEQLRTIREEYKNIKPEEIKVIDPCMGSGHILVYAFDVLMQIYESYGYSQRDAAKSIVENNIYGLDIDDRAFQLAYFAIMMKARSYNRRFLTLEIEPNLCAIQESNGLQYDQDMGDFLLSEEHRETLKYLLHTFVDAKEYGSILNVEKRDYDGFLEVWKLTAEASLGNVVMMLWYNECNQIVPILAKQAKLLSQKYSVVMTNPPYMVVTNGNAKLCAYVKDNYPDSKTDMFSVFIEKCSKMVKKNGFQAMITQHGWMFLTSFEKVRDIVLSRDVVNMAHLGARAFEEISGEVVQTASYVLRNSDIDKYTGCYVRLVDGNSQNEKEQVYLCGENRYYLAKNKFLELPGKAMVYWIYSELLHLLSGVKLQEKVEFKEGLTTAKNDLFMRMWYEVCFDKIAFSEPYDVANIWVPYNKGGSYRKWYGNNFYIVNWSYNGKLIREFPGASFRNAAYQLREGGTYSALSNNFAVRYSPAGFAFDSKGTMLFTGNDLKQLIAYLNSSVFKQLVSYVCPTLDFRFGTIQKLPLLEATCQVDNLFELSKEDWDAFEMSWDFKSHPLIMEEKQIEIAYSKWEQICKERFDLVKKYETEVNQAYIEKYNLQGIIEETVQDDEVSIRLADRERDIRSFISYAVGCILGRYSLSREGVVYTGGKWDETAYDRYKPMLDNIVLITDEEYLSDDITNRFVDFVRCVYGNEYLEQNLKYIADTLKCKGNSSQEVIRNYFVSEFFKDHCNNYSASGTGKRPVYWLFDSGKQNGFKALIYMHRYNADTIGNLRVDYLHRMERIYESEINRMQDTIDNSSNAREVTAATKRKEKLQKQLKECQEYDEKIGHLALSRIDIDLDDGVKVNYEKVQTASDGKKYQVLAKI
ncbi:MAG: BREX-1 system adenine-specific DNA-methyltransferase PglX [Lachnospiraceae bacterium]|nr:BREX-1 system adenine-specific DNA-methyltransferase PglX [Lachnospiraceae bacterium]